MADDSTPGTGAGPFFDFISQLRRMADQLDVTKSLGVSVPSVPMLPTVPILPPPGALSAAQLNSMSSAVAAQRGSIEGLLSQLKAFDDQLKVLEQILTPLTEWSRTWAELERTLMPPGISPADPKSAKPADEKTTGTRSTGSKASGNAKSTGS